MRRPFVLGLTGSIGMGKTTTAAMFADEGLPVWNADACVHRLYGPDGAATLAIRDVFPSAIAADGQVDRQSLRALIAADPGVLDRLTAIVHPLTAADRAVFLARHQTAEAVVLDIPLLFETGADTACDAVAVVSAPAEMQRDRVLARGMTPAEFALLLSRQMSDADKRARATYVIPTDTMAEARAAVRAVLADIRRKVAPDA